MRWFALAGSCAALLAGCGSTDAPTAGAGPTVTPSARPAASAGADAGALVCPPGTFVEGAACASFVAPACEVPPLPALDEVATTTDRVYTSPGRGTPSAAPQALDFARPVGGAGDGPVALFVHGGGWSGGDKRDHRDDIRRVAALGWVGVSVNYRLLQPPAKNLFPAGISDVRCAVRWIRAHAEELGANASRIVALGDSAGGELVELLGTEPGEAGLDDGQCELANGSLAVDGVVAYYARSDLSMAPVPQYVVDYVGRDGGWQAREALASALGHVDARTAPMLLVHGTADTRVPIAQSRAMRDALVKAGVDVGLVEVPAAGHGFPIFAMRGSGALGTCSTLAFLRHFR